MAILACSASAVTNSQTACSIVMNTVEGCTWSLAQSHQCSTSVRASIEPQVPCMPSIPHAASLNRIVCFERCFTDLRQLACAIEQLSVQSGRELQEC